MKTLFKQLKEMLSRKLILYKIENVDEKYLYIQKHHSALLSSKGDTVSQIDWVLFKARNRFSERKNLFKEDCYPISLVNIIYDCEKDSIIEIIASPLDNVRKYE